MEGNYNNFLFIIILDKQKRPITIIIWIQNVYKIDSGLFWDHSIDKLPQSLLKRGSYLYADGTCIFYFLYFLIKNS